MLCWRGEQPGGEYTSYLDVDTVLSSYGARPECDASAHKLNGDTCRGDHVTLLRTEDPEEGRDKELMRAQPGDNNLAGCI